MTRSIHCAECGTLKPMHPGDIIAGWSRRRVHITAAGSLRCDLCNVDLSGKPAVAVTMWRAQEGVPEPWEWRYEATGSQPPKSP